MKKIIVDLKSLITLMVTTEVIFLVTFVTITGAKIDSNIFLLFSNLTTMVFTYYFSKKSADKEKIE